MHCIRANLANRSDLSSGLRGPALGGTAAGVGGHRDYTYLRFSNGDDLGSGDHCDRSCFDPAVDFSSAISRRSYSISGGKALDFQRGLSSLCARTDSSVLVALVRCAVSQQLVLPTQIHPGIFALTPGRRIVVVCAAAPAASGNSQRASDGKTTLVIPLLENCGFDRNRIAGIWPASPASRRNVARCRRNGRNSILPRRPEKRLPVH